jgi:hypothetical protein
MTIGLGTHVHVYTHVRTYIYALMQRSLDWFQLVSIVGIFLFGRKLFAETYPQFIVKISPKTYTYVGRQNVSDTCGQTFKFVIRQHSRETHILHLYIIPMSWPSFVRKL